MSEITQKRKTGNLGEDLACRFLVKRGFEVIERNYLRKWGEIDIIAKKDNILHFVEVKSVSREIITGVSLREGGQAPETSDDNDYYRPEDNLHPWKLERLKRTIQSYLYEKGEDVSGACPVRETDWRFDVITVYIDKKRLKTRVFMLENIII